ncbi:MAG: glucose-1-phosphate adenylyltransferase subunit GlgD [Erysipelotrichaceae bacterium]|nr:glucose-1-phosphate adenylyltransferase subunit GlgD [Erysipelotrichaceae bacterium]
MTKVLGIVNIEPSYVKVEGIEDYRPISASSFMGRYRVIDFVLSNFTNSGIYNVEVQVKNRPRSTIEHIKNTDYNINTKRGKIRVLYGEKPVLNEVYNTDVASLTANLEFIEETDAAYVILAPSHFVYTMDYQELLDAHIASGNDITMLYQNVTTANEDFLKCDALEIDENGKVTNMYVNQGKVKRAKISLETYVMSKKTFIDLIYAAKSISALYSFSDALRDTFEDFKVGAYLHSGYAACISSLNAYYKASMEIKEAKQLDKMFADKWPIYTATNDTCPTVYKKGAKVENSIVGNGCQIEGTVINCVVGRNVVVKEGAVIKDSILMPDVLINKNVKMTKTVVDRLAIVTHVKELNGTDEQPLYVKRGDRI